MSYMRALRSTTGLKAGWTVTSSTRSPSIQTSRPSRSPARYSLPVRIMPVPYPLFGGKVAATDRFMKGRNPRARRGLELGPNAHPGSSSEHSPDVCKERIVLVRVSPHAVDIRGGPVKFVPVRILQADTKIQPWPERRAAVAEWQIGKLEYPVGTVRASGRRTVKRRIRSAPDRHSPRCEAPCVIIDIRNRRVQRPQLVVGIVREPKCLAGTRVVVLVNPGEPGSDRVWIAEILILGIDADIG